MTTDADVRADLASSHDAAWASLSRPGTCWSFAVMGFDASPAPSQVAC